MPQTYPWYWLVSIILVCFCLFICFVSISSDMYCLSVPKVSKNSNNKITLIP